jgi:hypothetical protein
MVPWMKSGLRKTEGIEEAENPDFDKQLFC